MKLNFSLAIGIGLTSVAARASVVNVHVVDAQSKEPMPGVWVGAIFDGVLPYGEDFEEKFCAKTDTRGNCLFRGKKGNPRAAVFNKELPNYYTTTEKIKLRGRGKGNPDPEDYHSVTLRLERIIKPIPLFVKEVSGSRGCKDFFGKGNDTIAYDLLASDWLPPQGTGSVADVQFTRLPEEDAGVATDKWLNVEVALRRLPLRVIFPGEGNGIAAESPLPGSDLMVRVAPETGYVHEHMSYSGKNEYGKQVCSWHPYGARAYCFRIRSRKNEAGEIVEGYYGKVYDGFSFDYAWDEDDAKVPIGKVEFRYYLNPTILDRNLEFDTRRNLHVEEGQVLFNP